ncbi:lipoprotein LppT, partial [Mycobacterium tuberculosis M1728]
NSRLPTTLNARDQPPAEVSDQRVSGLTGAVQNGRLAARVLVALAALFAMIALTGSACLAEGPPLGRNPQGAPAPVGGTVIVAPMHSGV